MGTRAAGPVVPIALALLAPLCLSPLAVPGQDAAPAKQTSVDLKAEVTLRVSDLGAPDFWRTLANATGNPVIAFLPTAHASITLDLVDVPLGRALSRIAAGLDGSWRTRGGIIVFGPAPAALGDEGKGWAQTEETIAAWARTLTETQMEDLVLRRLLPAETLTPEERRLTDQIDPSRGLSLRRGGPDAIPAVGLFFSPHCALYAGDQVEGVETARPAGLLQAQRQPRGENEPPVAVVPPAMFRRDAEGHLVPYPPGSRRHDGGGNLLPPEPRPPVPRDEPPADIGRPSVSFVTGYLHPASAVLDAIRRQTGRSVDADAPALEQDLFVSPGSYDAEDLLIALCHATGCPRIHEGETDYVAGTEAEAREMAGLPPLPQVLRRRHLVSPHLRHLFIRLIEEFDYGAAGMPFDADDFLDGQRTPLERFPPAQQAFIRRQVSDALLPVTEVRLFPAFSLTLASYADKCPPIPEALRDYVKSEESWRKMHENQWRAQGTLMIATVW